MMRPLHRLAACAAIALTLAPRVHAQASPATRLAGRVPPAAHAEVIAVIDSARSVGLPHEPLVQKALEGATKRADGRRIVQAVRTLAGELRTARLALGADASEADLVAGASALHAGVSPDVLKRLRRDRPKAPLTIALGVMAELIARGVPVAQTTKTVLALVENGARDDALVAFGRDVERDIGQGAPPGAATEIRSGPMFATDRGANAPGIEVSSGSNRPPTTTTAPRKP